MTTTKERAAVYLRISKHDPNIPKVENQEALCRELAARHDLDVVAVYTDDGISASKVGKVKKKDRPDWLRLLDDVREQKFDVLLAQAEDRFSREPLEKEVLDDLCAESGITYLTHADGATDPSKASGRLGSGIKALVARYYVATSSEKHRDSNAALRKKGLPMPGGDRRFGYEVDGCTPNEFEADLVRQAYRDVANGTRLPTGIARDWNGGVKVAGRQMRVWVRTTRGNVWSAPSVAQLLRRSHNAGIVTHRGDPVMADDGRPVEARWEPLVSEEDYLAAMKVLDDPARSLKRAHEPKHLCSGLVTCGSCDTPLAANSNARGVKYRCRVHQGDEPKRMPTGGHVEITAKILDDVVTKAVTAAVLFAPRASVTDPDTNRLRELRGRLADLNESTARLVRAVDEGALEPSDVAPRRRAIKQECADIESEIASIAASNARADLLSDVSLFLTERTSLEDAAKARATVRERFAALSLDQRRALVEGMLAVEVTPGGRGPERVRVTHKVALGLNEVA